MSRFVGMVNRMLGEGKSEHFHPLYTFRDSTVPVGRLLMVMYLAWPSSSVEPAFSRQKLVESVGPAPTSPPGDREISVAQPFRNMRP